MRGRPNEINLDATGYCGSKMWKSWSVDWLFVLRGFDCFYQWLAVKCKQQLSSSTFILTSPHTLTHLLNSSQGEEGDTIETDDEEEVKSNLGRIYSALIRLFCSCYSLVSFIHLSNSPRMFLIIQYVQFVALFTLHCIVFFLTYYV